MSGLKRTFTVFPRFLQHLSEEVVLPVQHSIVHHRSPAQVIVSHRQLFHRSCRVILTPQSGHDARHREPFGIEHGTAAQRVQHFVMGSLCLFSTLTAQVIRMIHQSVDGQVTFQPVEPETPLLQAHLTVQITCLIATGYHLVAAWIHRSDGNARGKSVVDVSHRKLLGKGNSRSRCHHVPVHRHEVVHRVVVGIVRTRILVLKSLQLHVALPYPVGTTVGFIG